MAQTPAIPPNQLETMVREHLERGRLPVLVSERVKASYGTAGVECDVCGLEIGPTCVEYEVTNGGGRPLFFHLRCHSVWQTECVRRTRKP